ncbi:helix-turn-helix domain-containing protein [Chryseobacterium soli]|uniref:helix-turn-helix domain-containing protein n=1 Tax=Chryseobacterium soli TaxID=445961 RepID=UPI00069210B6|nr:AraC family transcriptional regulator [Chryseobacterium soli]
MKYLFFILLFLISGPGIKAQNLPKTEISIIDKKLEDIRFNTKISDVEKEKDLYKLKSESEKIGYKWGILKSGRRIIEIYEKQNKNKEIIKLATELKKIDAGPQADRTIANIYRSNALALGYLGFDDASIRDFKTSITYAEKINNSNIKNYTLALVYEQMTIYFFNKRLENKRFKDSVINYHKKSLEAAKLIKDGDQEITTEKKYSLISFNYIRLGILYLEEADKPKNIQIAEKYLTKSLNIVNKYNLVEADKVLLLNQLSWLYLEKKDYQKTIEYAKMAWDLERQFPDPNNRVESFEFLATAYTEMGDTNNANMYMNKYSYLKDSIRIREKNNTDKAYNILLTDSIKTQEKKTYNQFILITGIVFMVAALALFSWRRQNRHFHEKYDTLVTKLSHKEGEIQTNANANVKNKETKITQLITDDISNSLLQKLEKFEKSEKYLRKDISIGWLAHHLDTNLKYLAEGIKIHRDNSFAEYINRLKINYIINKLYENPNYRKYKISYLAEECGYATPRVFLNAFKKETGITPSYFIKELQNEKVS